MATTAEEISLYTGFHAFNRGTYKIITMCVYSVLRCFGQMSGHRCKQIRRALLFLMAKLASGSSLGSLLVM